MKQPLISDSPINYNIAWSPLEGSQTKALDTRCDETLYTGTRGPGKTTIQLMRFARRVGLGYGSFWRGIIFGRSYKGLQDIKEQSQRSFERIFGKSARFYESSGNFYWEWVTGEVLMFRQITKEQEYSDSYHGQEFPYIGWNELTQWPTAKLYNIMMSCNRSSWTQEKDAPKGKSLPDIPLEVFSTTNSEGPGHNWVKRKFIDVAPYGRVVYRTIRVFNPRTQQEEDIVRSQIAIFGSYRENKYLSPIYIAGLTEACLLDENKYRSWLLGDWNIVAGGAFDDLWDNRIHVIPIFRVPHGYRLDRSFDWGSTHPFSVGWWAEANGEEFMFPSGRKMAPRPGSLIQIGEYYGAKSIGDNEGIKMPSKVIATQIKQREIDLMRRRVVSFQPSPGPADNQIDNVTDTDTDTIAKKMADMGIRWTASDKSKGSRVIGLELMRQMLYNAKTGEGPGLYFVDECIASISTIPVLPRDEKNKDDIDTTAEDHAYDMVRYRVLKAGARLAGKSMRVTFPT